MSRTRRAITLVELLIAITILVIVTGSTMLVFRGITKAWKSGQMRTERYQQARLLFDLFSRELPSSVANARYPFVGLGAGQEATIKDGSQYAELFFVGALPGRSGLVERGYWVNQDGQLMCHDEEPADGDYESTGSDELCGSDVTGFEVAYHDGQGWLTGWDGRAGSTQAGQIPKAVRITLTVGRQAGERFETIIRIPTS